MSLFALMFLVSFISCGDEKTTDTAGNKFGITGVALSVGAEKSTEKVSRVDLPDGAYVTWETWIENSQWPGFDGAQPGSFTAWDIQTPVVSGDNVSQIVGLAKTCICTDIDNNTGNLNIYYCYYGSDYFYLATRGTLHLPDGSTYASEYRQAIPITAELQDYIDHEVMGKNADTVVDRLTLTLSYTVDPSLL